MSTADLTGAQQAALKQLEAAPSPEALWACMTQFAGVTFHTSKGLAFTYAIRGNELFVDRKAKSITRATVVLAYEKALSLGDAATGPKTLGCFGASYLYPIFSRLGVITMPLVRMSRRAQSQS